MTTYERVVESITRNARQRSQFAQYSFVAPVKMKYTSAFLTKYSGFQPYTINGDDIQNAVRFKLKANRSNSLGSPCQSLIAPIQQKFIARDLYRLLEQECNVTKALGFVKLNKKRRSKFDQYATQIVQLLISAFYNSRIRFSWWQFHDHLVERLICPEDTQIYFYLLAQYCYDAVGLGQKTLDPKYRSSTVVGIIQQMRHSENFDFPILADALQDAGFGEAADEAELLQHYRTSRFFGLGSWIFRAIGEL